MFLPLAEAKKTQKFKIDLKSPQNGW